VKKIQENRNRMRKKEFYKFINGEDKNKINKNSTNEHNKNMNYF
jgi:hypothetical protein